MMRLSVFPRSVSSLVLTLVLSIPIFAACDVTLPAIIGENMVLQRDMKLNIWGWADPGESVAVEIAGNSAETTASEEGRWSVVLPEMKAGGPHKMTVTGKNTIAFQNVLVGDVWLCSGQSNMEYSLAGAENGKEAAEAANYPEIRLITVPKTAPGRPIDSFDAAWFVCTPQSAPRFSAVGYFFGVEIHNEIGVPVGLINASWGGTAIEPWTPPEGFASVPELKEISTRVSQAESDYEKTLALALEQFARWQAEAKEQLASQDGPKDIAPPPAWPQHPLQGMAPTGIYNGMISPIVPFAIRGAIWYQGEANVGQGMKYLYRMKALIDGWREIWGEGDFPFYYVQIAPFTYNQGEGLPKIWEAQTAALALPNTGMAVTNDVGNTHDIHPNKKQAVGHRLALWALAKTYGRTGVVYSGPLFKDMAVDGSKAIISFEHTGSGLTTRDGKSPDWFELAGEDKEFVKAVAVIEGDRIILTASGVETPVAARFAWDEKAEPNLMNKEGLPASAFRTYDW